MEEGASEVDAVDYARASGVELGSSLDVDLKLVRTRVDDGGERWHEYILEPSFVVSTCEGVVVSLDSDRSFRVNGSDLIGKTRLEITELMGIEPVIDFEEVSRDWSFATLEWLSGNLQVTEIDGVIGHVLMLESGQSELIS